MVCFKVCVVFMIVGNISGHVLNGSPTDLEKALKEHYNIAAFKPMDHDSPTNVHSESSQHITKEEQILPRKVLTMSYKDFSGPPLQFYKNIEIKDDTTRSSFRQAANEDIPQEVLDSIFMTSIQKPVGEPSALHSYKEFNEKDAMRQKNKQDIDLDVLKSIWNSTPDEQNKTVNTLMFKIDMKNTSSSPDVLTVSVTESALAANGTGSTFSNEHRFLSEKFLRDSWLKNVDKGEKSETTSKARHFRMPRLGNPDHVVPSKNNTASRHNLSKFIAMASFIFVTIQIMCEKY